MSRRILGFSSFIVLSLPLIGPALLRAADSDSLKFELFEDKEKEFRWRLKQGEDILGTAGQGYKEKASCKKAIEGIRKGLENDKDKFEVYEDKAKAFRWRLKAANADRGRRQQGLQGQGRVREGHRPDQEGNPEGRGGGTEVVRL